VAPEHCVICGSAALIPILYGMPTSNAFAAAQRGELVIAGCDLHDEVPTARCRDCGHDQRPRRPAARTRYGWAVGDEVTAFYWSPQDGGRWSLQRRPHRVTSTDPLRGVEFWYDADKGYTEGQEHDLDDESAEPYPRRPRQQ
jgi:hypothetical protein